jgi:N-acetylglucosamine-6-phosphate deacetylase
VTTGRAIAEGRLVLDDRVVAGRLVVEDGLIADIEVNEAGPDGQGPSDGPFIAPGFVDVHVHGGGGHDAMAGPAALDGMARHLLARGVTSFLPTAVTAPPAALIAFADSVRDWMPMARPDGAAALGFNLEGPFLAPSRRGAHDPAGLRVPADVARADLEPLLDGLRLITVAPELNGALELIGWLRDHGVATSLGHSDADLDQARAGFAAGATGTTHLFNAMSRVDHYRPGLAVAALDEDGAYVELIADGEHVHPSLWPIISRTKPDGRLVLVSDAIPQAGLGDGRAILGGLECVVVGNRVTLVGTTTLAGSVIALDTAVRNLVAAGLPVWFAVAAVSRNPLALIGVTDRGRLAVGQRADLVELDDGLRVRRVMREGAWVNAAPG